MLKKLKILIVFFLLLNSCQITEIDLELPDSTPKIVVNSLITSDSIFKVEIAQTSLITDSIYTIIDDAEIKLYENDIYKGTLKNQNNIYTLTNFIPSTYKTYQINIKTAQFEESTANAYIPQKISILNSSETKNAGVTSEGYYYSALNIQFEDIPNEKNYYQIFIKIDSLKRVNFEDSAEYISYTSTIFSNDPVITNEIGIFNDDPYLIRPEFVFFSDELFDGELYNLELNFCPIYKTSNNNEDYNIIIYFNSISENYYSYLISYYQYFSEMPEIFNFQEPFKLYSNIKNGYGIFAGYNMYIDTLK